MRRLFIAACWLTVLAAYVAAILPQAEAPHLRWSDKIDHMVAFFVVTMLARLSYPRAPVPRLFLIIVAFGGFIELSQALPMIHRDAEWDDWLADGFATLIGLVAAWPLAMFAERRRARRAL